MALREGKHGNRDRISIVIMCEVQQNRDARHRLFAISWC